MHDDRKNKAKPKVRDEDIPRDAVFHMGAQVLKDFAAQTQTRSVGMRGANVTKVSAATTRKIGDACMGLRMTASDFVSLFLRLNKPTAKVYVNSLLGHEWLAAAAEQVHAQRSSAAKQLGKQMVRTKDGAVCAADLDPDMQVQVADIESALGYAWGQIRAVSGRCVIDAQALEVLRLPLGNIEAWVRCFLSGLDVAVVRTHGEEATQDIQRNPMLRDTLQNLQFDVARLEHMVANLPKS